LRAGLSSAATAIAPVGGTADESASPEELLGWVAEVTGGEVERAEAITGGNRARSWAVDVRAAGGRLDALYLRYQPPRPPSAEPYTVKREALIYRAIAGAPVPAPRLIAEHPRHEAILTERVPGRAEFRRIASDEEKTVIAREFMAALAALHRMELQGLALPGRADASIAACVRAELATWRAMYEETGQVDPLIELALDWLETRAPDPPGPPVLVHGDAGPGNFLFDEGHLTALLDWELAHLGDPMEDLAWFSMRSVMEPVPDFAARLREYEAAGGAPIDPARVRYHRVFVSARVVIIRHRNVTGEPGNSIVSRALNRRLLVEAIAEASGLALPAVDRIAAPQTERTALYDGVVADLRDEIAAHAGDRRAVAAAKNAAKVLKYLREVDRLGAAIEARERAAAARLLGLTVASPEEGRALALEALRAGRLGLADALALFAESAAHDAQLAAGASGGLATRGFPSLDD
jgi:aminoglycoside phosphotransferase (APT) family kinase protein